MRIKTYAVILDNEKIMYVKGTSESQVRAKVEDKIREINSPRRIHLIRVV